MEKDIRYVRSDIGGFSLHEPLFEGSDEVGRRGCIEHDYTKVVGIGINIDKVSVV